MDGTQKDSWRRSLSGVEVAKGSQARVTVGAHYHMIQHVDFEELPGSDQIARYLDVSFGWLAFP